MSERENILGRIREALQVLAPVPGEQDHAVPHPPTEREAATHISEWLPAVGESFEARVELFAKNSIELTTDFHLLESAQAAAARLVEIANADGWQRVATHTGGLSLPAARALGLPVLSTDASYEVR